MVDKILKCRRSLTPTARVVMLIPTIYLMTSTMHRPFPLPARVWWKIRSWLIWIKNAFESVGCQSFTKCCLHPVLAPVTMHYTVNLFFFPNYVSDLQKFKNKVWCWVFFVLPHLWSPLILSWWFSFIPFNLGIKQELLLLIYSGQRLVVVCTCKYQ